MTKPTDIPDLMQKMGASFEEVVELLYGVVGSNKDTRDWNAIMASSDPLAAARAATGQMYSNSAATTVPDRQTAVVSNTTGAPAIVKYTTTAEGLPKEVYGIAAADGTLLRGGYTDVNQAVQQGANFGLSSTTVSQGGTEKMVTQPASAVTQTTSASQPASTTSTATQSQPASTTSTATQSQPASTSGSRVVDGIRVPDWVNPAYIDSYVATAKAGDPRKPFQVEIAPAFGLDLNKEEDMAKAINLLYGVVGSNKDIRDWDAILASPNPTAAAAEATKQLFDVITSGNAPELLGKTGSTLSELQKNPAIQSIKPISGTQLVVVNNELVLKDPQGNMIAGITPQNAALYGVTQEQINSFLNTSGLAANPLQQEYVSKWSNAGYNPSSLSSTNFLKSGSPKVTTGATTGAATSTAATSFTPTPAQPQPPVTQQTTPPAYGTQQIRPTVAPPFTAPPTVASPIGVYPMQPTTGTFSVPTSTGTLSAVPQAVMYRQNYTGTPGNVPETLYQAQQQQQKAQQGVRNVMYRNAQGATMYITEANGVPMTAVPEGYVKVQGQAEGGMTQQQSSSPFNTQQKFQLLQRMGYRGPASDAQMDQFIAANPAASARFGKLSRAATKRMGMAKGGVVKGYQEGGLQTNPQFTANVAALQQTGAQQPTMAPVSMIQPEAAQFIPSDAGMTVPQAPFAEAATMQQAEQAMMPVMTPASLMQAAGVAPAMTEAMAGVAPATGQVSDQAQVQAAQQAETSVSQLQAAQGQAHMMNNPVQREIQAGELVTGAADAAKAAQFVEQIQAAEATPTKQATVQGQLEGLMQQFEGGATPAWAAGAMRNAMATLSARGLGASSLAGQAVVQAAMESAIPIAQIDAQTRASFESQNLSNRQQVAMFAAQQRAAFMQMEFDQAFQSRVQNAARIADVANMNFTAEQQVALENSRAVNTMNLANLGNRQAMVMAEAAALSNLDMANLNNRQQAAVQNAQNFLQMDMANLSNEQQTALFRAQQTAQALFTDQAAENASRQFNATSENQTKQFFASLSSQVSQFNAAQRNAIDQYNIDQVNSLRRFNSEIQQQRDLFNAQNGLVIAQANAQWRQNLTTLNTAAQNESNRQFAQVLNNMSQTTLDQIWQRERDLMTFAFTQSENSVQRATEVLLQQMEIEGRAALEAGKSQGTFFSKLIDAGISVISKNLAG